MKGFDCKIPILKVDFQDCIQVAAIQLFSFYGVEKTLSDVKKEIPVYVSKRGLTLGSSIGHMATYFLKLGLKLPCTLLTSKSLIEAGRIFQKEN